MNKQDLMKAYPDIIGEIIADALVDEANELMNYTHEFKNASQMLTRCYGLISRDASFAGTRLSRLYQAGIVPKPQYDGYLTASRDV
jgi:hypothetical protein